MLQAGYTSHTTPFVTSVNQDQIREIIGAAYMILEQTGCKVEHPGALEMLAKSGAKVDGDRVTVSRYVIDKAITAAPKGFVMYNRGGMPVMDLTGNKSYFGSSTGSPNQRHAIDQERKPTTIEDIRLGAIVADALENIDFVMPFGTAQDVPAASGDLFEFETVIQNTVKPIFFCGYSSNGVDRIIDMAREVAGGEENLAEKPFIAAYPEPISPLQFPLEIVEKIKICARRMVPQVISGAQFMGFTSPCTVAGSLALATAESFFGILLAQLFRPGAPCCLTCSSGSGNMRTGISFISSPEMTLSLTAQAQIARTLGLPTWGLAGATNAKALDGQAGAEAALSAVLQALAGVNIIHDVGYMDMGMVCSCAMMVMGNEIIHWIKRYMSGVEVNAQTLAVDVIKAVGPGGHFMTQKHTIDFMRKEIWQPELFCKDSYEVWVKEGAETLEQRADQKVADILSGHQPNVLTADVISKIEAIREWGVKEIEHPR